MKTAVIIFAILFTSCTISLQNVSTHGEADDLIDDQQSASPSVPVHVELPALSI